MRLRGNRVVLAAVAAACLLAAGCAGAGVDDGTADGEGDPSSEVSAATQQRLAETRAEYDRLDARVGSLSDRIDDAAGKGVNVSAARTRAEAARTRLDRADEDLAAAAAAVDRGRPGAVRERTVAAATHLAAANDSVTAGRTRLEAAYRTALDASRARLQGAYAEYQVAVAYVEAAGDAGGDTAALRERINRSRGRLRTAREAVVEDRNPGRARTLAAEINASARRVREEAVEAGRRGVARRQLRDLRGRLDSERAGALLDEAEAAVDAGDLDRFERRALAAQRAEQAARVATFTRRVAVREGVALAALNESLAAYRAADAGTGADATASPNATALGERARTARRCLVAFARARNATAAARAEQAVLIGADFSGVDRRLDAAREALHEGRYEAACTAADGAREEARAIGASLRERRASTLFVLDLGSIGSLLGGDRPDGAVPPVDPVDVRPVEATFEPPTDVATDRLNVSAAPVDIDVASGGRTGSVAFRLGDVTTSACGSTCRDVSATLTNVGTATATNVSATVEIRVRGGDRVKRFTVPVGELAPGESETASRRLTFGVAEALAIREDGARVVVTITSDQTITTVRRTVEV